MTIKTALLFLLREQINTCRSQRRNLTERWGSNRSVWPDYLVDEFEDLMTNEAEATNELESLLQASGAAQ